MRKIVIFAGLALLAATVGCSAGEGSTPADVSAPVEVTGELLSRGQDIYKLNCVPCHGPGGKGDGPSAASLNPKPRDHTNPELMDKLTDKKIAQTVQMGGAISGYPNMPASPHIRGDDLVALVAFVRSLHRPGVSAIDVEGVGQ